MTSSICLQKVCSHLIVILSGENTVIRNWLLLKEQIHFDPHFQQHAEILVKQLLPLKNDKFKTNVFIFYE